MFKPRTSSRRDLSRVQPARNAERFVAAAPADNSSGFRNIADFARAVRFANPAAGQAFRMDDRLAALPAVHQTVGDPAGAYLVPAEFRQQIVNLVLGDSDDQIMNLIAPEPTSANRVFGLGDTSTPWGNAGVSAYWRSEGEQMTPSRLALTPRETKLGELYAFVLVTEEMLEDAPRMASLLTVHAARAIRWKAVDAFMYGDGIEKPLGWANSPATIVIGKDAGQPAGSITARNLRSMYARMLMPGQAYWFVGSDAIPTLMEVQNSAGVPLYGDLQGAPNGSLLGRPIVLTEHARSVGQSGDIQFVNPKGYEAFRKQSGVAFAESIHLYFDYNIRAFRWIFRLGGQPVLGKPVMPANGGTTKSHFVVLEERA